ncbi:hypothetical protein GX408_20765 [bacterium]|nr:hypothetical protein [bacterium]
MQKKYFTLFVGILFCLLLMGTAAAQPLLLRDRQVMVVLGNSITEGGELPEGYVSLMRKALEVLYPEMTVYIINAGISGHKSTDMYDRFDEDVLRWQPNWVTISVGVNDVWHGFYDNHPKGDGPRGVPLSVYREKVTAMVQRAQRHNARVALFTATVIKETLTGVENQKLVLYNQAIRDIAKKFKCVLVDQDAACRRVLAPLQRSDMADRGVLTSDGVHMLPAGNWLMAKTCLMALGVEESRLDAAKPLIENLVIKDQQALQKSLERYCVQNHELSFASDPGKRIVFYGSSSVDGWPLHKDFPRSPLLNRGIGGETTRQLWLRFRQDVLQLHPTGVIIFLGSANDFWPEHRMCPGHTLANLSRMVRMARSKNIKVAVGAIMPVNDYLPGEDVLASHPIERVQQLNRQIKEFCAGQQIPFIDFYSSVADESGKLRRDYSDDGMHCNRKGYDAWKPLVEDVLTLWEIR